MKSNEAAAFLMTRRSIRKYSSERIREDTIQSILKVAMHAPSAVNKQPWHFIVIDDPGIFEKVRDIHPHASFITGASHAILVLGDEQLQHGTDYWHVDCASATQTLLLAAHGYGVGSCWIGIYPREKRLEDFSRLFNLPHHIHPFALVSLGYPMESRTVADRFREERIHYNEW
jgi:nitroreductase